MRPAQTSRCDASVLLVQAAAKTDMGLVRRSNQDSFGSDGDHGLYVVCDGMGGAAGGEVASSLAVEAFLSTARQELASACNGSQQATCAALQRAAAAANRAVFARAGWDTRYRGMGSTLVAAQIAGDALSVVNVGDSRAYLVRGGRATQLTQDHSFIAEQVRSGRMTAAEAERSPMQAVITRAIGAEADVRADVFAAALQPGDTVLLASDGLTRHVAAAELAEIVAAGSAQRPAETCQRLIDLARERGGLDNITVIVVRMLAGSGADTMEQSGG